MFRKVEERSGAAYDAQKAVGARVTGDATGRLITGCERYQPDVNPSTSLPAAKPPYQWPGSSSVEYPLKWSTEAVLFEPRSSFDRPYEPTGLAAFPGLPPLSFRLEPRGRLPTPWTWQMADVRSLLRQQREIRRIEHPHAAYTDAGKLLCTLCREHIKAEALWDGHVQAAAHVRRLQAPSKANGHLRSDAAGAKHKRKLDDGDDADAGVQDAIRRKRSRADLAFSPSNGFPERTEQKPSGGNGSGKETILSPPGLSGRTSTTPSQGIELQIPSRPATPSRRDVSSSSTPGLPPPLQPSGTGTGIFSPSLPIGSLVLPTASGAQTASIAPQVDEAEWAAFEADMAAENVSYDQNVVISAPAMTAEESAAAKASADKDGDRRAKVDVDIEEEREEAKRAIEDEFQDMHELEERVRRLKEKREALRRGEGLGQKTALEKLADVGPGEESKHCAVAAGEAAGEKVNGEGEVKEGEEDEYDDWDGFRFRTS